MIKTTLLPMLADGDFRSGQDLADALGVSRTAVWKQLNKLGELGLEVESVKGRGYRIPGGLDLLNEETVREAMRPEARQLLGDLLIFPEIDSTNAEAMRRIEQGAGSGLACTAEQQMAGRGRLGRQWVSPFARNIYLSLMWEFSQGAAALEGLSLAVGVAAARALEQVGVRGARLKWPNDILFEGDKLGGILLEMVGDASGTCQVVIGIGINVAMPAAAGQAIDQRWTDLAHVAGEQAPSRNILLAALLDQLLPLAAGFEASGFGPWQAPWSELDAFAGTSVILHSGDHRQGGVCRGVDERGALQLETTTGIQKIYGGEISLRPAN
ncbi:MAG: bifunctional biotin--[acetyl-CoA-carboxylase] ligase/biotin operon repressor BirA [Halieaceae bacterium]